MTKVKIKTISRKERTSTRTGKPFISLGIKTEEHGDKWLSGFGSKDNEYWKEGDEVEIIIEQKGEYLNFTTPKKEDKMNEGVEKILNKLTSMNLDIQEIKAEVLKNKPKLTSDGTKVPDFSEVDEPTDY